MAKQLFANNARTTTTQFVNSTQTTITVFSNSGFPVPTNGDFFLATINFQGAVEIVKVTAISGSTWTIVRGQESSGAQFWPLGATIEMRVTADSLAWPLNNYTELRAYRGNKTTILIQDANTAGIFVLDPTDNTSADNGGTILVTVNGARYKRIISDNWISLNWFYSGTGTYDAAIAAAIPVSTATTYPIRFPPVMTIAGPINLPAWFHAEGSHGGANATSTYGTVITHVPTANGVTMFNTLGTALSTVTFKNMYLVGASNGFTSAIGINYNGVLGGVIEKVGFGQAFTTGALVVSSAQDIRLKDINIANANTTTATPAGLLFTAGGVESLSTSVKADGIYVHGVAGATGGITTGIVMQGDSIIQSEFRLPTIESTSQYAINIHKGNQVDFYSTYTENTPNIDHAVPIVRIGIDTPSAVRITSVNFYGGGMRGPNTGFATTFGFDVGIVANLEIDGIVFNGLASNFMNSAVNSTNKISITNCSCGGLTSFGTIGSPQGLFFGTNNKFPPRATPAIHIGAGPTTSRPTFYLFINQQFFDTTLGKPIWWNGTVWKDATGATV